MQKDILSALIDGETELKNIDVLLQDNNTQQSWANYHLIQDCLQETDIILTRHFTQKLQTLIENETLPERLEQPQIQYSMPPLWQKMKPAVMPLMQMGIAASVCLVAVFGVSELTKQPNESPLSILQTLPFNQDVQGVSFNLNAKNNITYQQVEEKNKRMVEMLQHYELQRRIAPLQP